jgi:hypothetical protein
MAPSARGGANAPRLIPGQHVGGVSIGFGLSPIGVSDGLLIGVYDLEARLAINSPHRLDIPSLAVSGGARRNRKVLK